MPSIISLIKKLRVDFPQFSFQESTDFSWSHSDSTIYFNKTDDQFEYLFHELAHGLLDHANYKRDIELLIIERKTWEKAIEIAQNYGLLIDNEFIQASLDTYRDWLHSRSTCPKCNAIGVQDEKDCYKCLACKHKWRVNEARMCALRRYSNTK